MAGHAASRLQQRCFGCRHRRCSRQAMPSARKTRWHGTTTGSGLVAQAVPTARTASGLPTNSAIFAIAAGLPVADLRQMPLHQLAETVRQRQVERRRRRPDDAWRNTRRVLGPRYRGASVRAGSRGLSFCARRVENAVVVLARVGHPHQSSRGRGQQQAGRPANRRSVYATSSTPVLFCLLFPIGHAGDPGSRHRWAP